MKKRKKTATPLTRLWIVTGILCVAAFALYYRFFFEFFPRRR